MTYHTRRKGFVVTRLISTGIAGFTMGKPNQLMGFIYVDAAGNIVTHPCVVDEVCVQLPQPRGNVPLNGYDAGAVPFPTDALIYMWDIGPFNPTAFAGNPIPGLPDPADAVLVLRPWGDGISGGGTGSAPASARTSTTPCYKIPVNRRFPLGFLCYFQNPEKLAIVTYNAGVGNPFHAGRTLLGGGGANGAAVILDDTAVGATGTIRLVANSVAVPFTVGAALTEVAAGATGTVVTYEAQIPQAINCQIHVAYAPMGAHEVVAHR